MRVIGRETRGEVEGRSESSLTSTSTTPAVDVEVDPCGANGFFLDVVITGHIDVVRVLRRGVRARARRRRRRRRIEVLVFSPGSTRTPTSSPRAAITRCSRSRDRSKSST